MKAARTGGLKTVVSRSYLPVGRLCYAGASGLALVTAAAIAPSLSVVGEYIYQIGFASAAATLSGLGLDRIMARQMASGGLRVGIPFGILNFRVALAALVILIAVISGLFLGNIPVFVAAGVFVVSRMLYADLEAIWIGAKVGDKSLFVALVLNGFVTAGGIVFGAYVSSAAMIGLSSLGNLLALCFLLMRGRLVRQQVKITGLIKEANGISWSLLLGIVYARVDLVILASVGSSLESVALYGIVTRVFDALVLIRGSLAQDEARNISSLRIRTKARRLLALALRTQFVALLISILAFVFLWICSSNRIELLPGTGYESVVMVLVALPLFFSHLPTTSMIYSDRRTHRLLIGSVITCVGSVVLKWFLISQWNIAGAILAIGFVEILSAAVFYFLYWANARSFRSFRIVLIPLASAAFMFGLAEWIF